VNLLRRVGNALGDDDPPVAAIEVRTLDRAVIEMGDAHIGPIYMARSHIHDDAIGEVAIRDNNFVFGAVRIHGVNAVAAQLEEE
jgi:hypothetical protein